MPDTGGRDEIGPYPGRAVKWLYTGDQRLFEMVSTMADLAGAWPLHIREGDPAKRFDHEGRIAALGRPLSVHARPSLWLFDDRDHSKAEDRVVVRGPRMISNTAPKYFGGWTNDGAHQPDPYSALYTLTGDPFALEQMQFWAASQALSYDPVYKVIPASGIFMEQTRGCAWVLRNRCHAAFLSPDGTPEKAYFSSLMEDVVGFWEGRFGIEGTKLASSRAWQAAQARLFRSPLHFFRDQAVRSDLGLLVNHASTVDGLWQNYMLIFELGRAKERGFSTGPLLSWLSEALTGHFVQPAGYDPLNFQRYYTAVRDEHGEFYKTWPDTLVAFKDREPRPFNPDVGDGYGAYGYAASTMTIGEQDGREAYEWLRRNGYEPLHAKYAENPKWAFLPRT